MSEKKCQSAKGLLAHRRGAGHQAAFAAATFGARVALNLLTEALSSEWRPPFSREAEEEYQEDVQPLQKNFGPALTAMAESMRASIGQKEDDARWRNFSVAVATGSLRRYEESAEADMRRHFDDDDYDYDVGLYGGW